MAVPRPTPVLAKSVALAGATALLVGFSATSGRAAPGDPAPPPPTTASAAMAQLRTTSAQLEQVSQQYVNARAQLTKRTAESKAAAAKAESATRAVAGYRNRVKQLVRAESLSAPFGAFGAMLSSDSPAEFAAQASLIDAVATRRGAVLTEAAKAGAAAIKADRDAKAAAAEAAKLARELATKRADLSRRTAASRTLYNRLSATERQAFLASAGQGDDRGSRSNPRSEPMPSVPASGRAAVAVASARAQVGKPYVWGATGPGSFDCSGLTSYVWRQAGVSIPRTSRDQYAAGVKVSRSALRPGDLVYFGMPIYHVAVYIGGGQMVSAPEPGQLVKYQSMTVFPDYTGATRPG